MKAFLWGWFDAPNVMLRDPETNDRRPVAVSPNEAAELGVEVTRLLVLETAAGQLVVVTAAKAGNPTLDESKRCAVRVEPGSSAWLLTRLGDGEHARIARELERA